MDELTDKLIQRVRSLKSTDTSRTSLVRCLVDWAGCAMGGRAHVLPSYMDAAGWVFGASADCTVVGRRDRTGVFEACLVNGTSSHVLDLDDVLVSFHGHPAVVIVPAVFALGERAGASGAAVLRAVEEGYEAADIVGRLVDASIGERGWHPTAVLGCLAAAVASSTLLGLDEEQTGAALGLAATQAGGVRAVFGSHGKGIHAGRAAATGALSAVAVAEGIRVPSRALSGPAGLLQAGFGIDRDVATANMYALPIASEPAVVRTAFKRHAACGATHSLIDSVAEVVAENNLDPEDIARIDARVHRAAMTAAGIPNAATPLEAKFSLRHLAALAAYTHPIGPEVLTEEHWTSDAVFALREHVHLVVDEEFQYKEATAAEATLTTRDGTAHSKYVDLPKGRPSNPLSDADMDAKFRSLAEPILGVERADSALAALRGIESVPNCRTVIGQLSSR